MQILDIEAFIKVDPDFFSATKYPAKTILLEEGKISNRMFLVKEGALREYFLHDGRELTLEFITENQAVASFDSFLNATPSDFTIETLEASTLYELDIHHFHELMKDPSFQQTFTPLFQQRFSELAKRLMTFIKNSPEERYIQLLESKPELLLRFPQHYIASYLGITSVSLSRIRNRR